MSKVSNRISREQMCAEMIKIAAKRCTCSRAKVGAMAEIEGRPLCVGYAGAPSGLPHCIDVGCTIVDGHCIATIHAEQNVIAFAAKHGISLKGARLWVTHTPCKDCAKLIINAGITSVVFLNKYGDVNNSSGCSILKQVGIDVYHYHDNEMERL